jgi:hypothetical protein
MAAVNWPAQPRFPLASLQFSLTVFFGAFLLFWTQLILGKFILPWFGGTPTVWTTCMLFFQVLLLAGYVYSHILANHLSGWTQALTHSAVLSLSVAALFYLATTWDSPITPAAYWKPEPHTDPVLRILSVLAIAVGLPYFALSATGPLLQTWYQRLEHSGSPYRLYAVSNLGSFLVLFAFPIVLEPHLPLKVQGRLWTAGYILFAVSCCASAFLAARGKAQGVTQLQAGWQRFGVPSGESTGPPSAANFALWFALAATASVVFLATTNQLCQDVAVVPLLWIPPLAIYLLSFILCFEHPRWYARKWFHATFPLALCAACFVLYNGALGSIATQVGIYLAVLFCVCMVCHGELARSKPWPRYLTAFYLAVAAGGASGGIFVGLLAPRLFTGFWEYQLGLLCAASLLLLNLSLDRQSPLYQTPAPVPVLLLAMAALLPESVALAVSPANRISNHFALLVAAVLFMLVFFNRRRAAPEAARSKAVPICAAAALAVAAVVFTGTGFTRAQKPLARFRNFYGTLSVLPRGGGVQDAALTLAHGRVVHGFQLQNAAYKRVPTAYYAAGSGFDQAFQLATAAARTEHRAAVHIGAVGLGIGTVAAYAHRGDTIRFYEINPQVIALASNAAYFTYLSDSPAQIEIVPGDGRLSLEREAGGPDSQTFDLLVLDAFSGDSVPVHLLTREAFAAYLRRLHKATGILAVHITNTYLDLRPVVIAAAEYYGLHSTWIHATGDDRISGDSEWMLLSYGPLPKSSGDLAAVRPVRPWTDDYSNLLQILRK